MPFVFGNASMSWIAYVSRVSSWNTLGSRAAFVSRNAPPCQPWPVSWKSPWSPVIVMLLSRFTTWWQLQLPPTKKRNPQLLKGWGWWWHHDHSTSAAISKENPSIVRTPPQCSNIIGGSTSTCGGGDFKISKIGLHMVLNIEGVFFNWPPPEFAKCWPVSNWFQKNVRVPDWPPLWSENG